MSYVERAALRAELAAESTPEYAGVPPPVRAASTSPADVAPGAAVEAPGHTRRTRLALAPAVRAKIERIESQAAAARAEVFRLGDLLDTERDRLTQLVRTENTWRANYMRDITRADVEQLEAERVAVEAELARLTAQRDVAQERWQRLNRLAERCRVYLGLPSDGRRS